MNDIFVGTEHFTNQPDGEGRLEKEMNVYKLLDRLEIPYDGIDHDVTPTIEACKAVEDELGVMPCKNLFLCNRQKTDFYLLLMPGEKKFRTKDLSKQLGTARLSFADPEYMEAFLDIHPGAVSPLGLMNDHEGHVRLLVDRDLLKFDYMGCHPCVNTSSLRMKTTDILERFAPAVEHGYTVVEL